MMLYTLSTIHQDLNCIRNTLFYYQEYILYIQSIMIKTFGSVDSVSSNLMDGIHFHSNLYE